jgi:hypothetical protein
LAGERVGDEQHFVGSRSAAHFRRLIHQRLVKREPAGSVEQHHIVTAEPRRFFGARRDLDWSLPLDHSKRLHANLPAEYRELLHRRRPAGVERGHQHFALGRIGKAFGDFRRGGGFAGALQSDHHDDDWRWGIEIDRLSA